MTPESFIQKWRHATLKERSAAQEHFIDLCRLLGVPTPAEADPTGAWYCFERGAKKTGGGDALRPRSGQGWADVWRRGCFGWEYKGKGKSLAEALKQLQLYALALESPPLLIVSDIDSIVIHTAFTNAVPEVHVIALDDIADPEQRRRLKWAFTEPERLRPGRTVGELTEQAAGRFAALAEALCGRGHEPHRVAHFLNKLLFCLFAEDVELLPRQLFTHLLESALKMPEHLEPALQGLFRAMAGGGLFGYHAIDWFNGGLFDGDDTLPLEKPEVQALLDVSRLDWSAIEPAIFGTLFERGLDPAKRSQLGAHYTDRGSILRIVDPVIREPLLAEWEAAKAVIGKDKSKGRKKAEHAYAGFLERLRGFRVLDPACGSGNFLYLALQTLKDLEHRAILEAEALGLPRQFPGVGPETVHGIELNPYAAELARVTVWIGEIQWMLKHGYNLSKNPILRPLDTIEQRDAVMNPDGTEADWPEVDVIVGNPPFLGGGKIRGELGEEYQARLWATYKNRVPGGADLVCYWFEKARAQIEAGQVRRAGLVATNSIRGGANRKVLERICESGRIFNAWSDEPWVNEGAAVRVSLVCFGAALDHSSSGSVQDDEAMLDGQAVDLIHADLTGASDQQAMDLTKVPRLTENAGFSFIGTQQNGPFAVAYDAARQWLLSPNPHGASNADVVKPWRNGQDITRRSSDTWIVDFGCEMNEEEAALYEHPFQYVLTTVKPMRDQVNREIRRRNWWRLGEAMPKLRAAIRRHRRYIATPRVAKHRLFVWLHTSVLPDCQLVVIARSDDATFGVLHSRFHELWALRMCTWLGVGNDPRYTPTTTFETFPFPEGVLSPLPPGEGRVRGSKQDFTPLDTERTEDSGGAKSPLNSPHPNPLPEGEGVEDPDARFPAIAAAARRLNELRENWLNPPEWAERVPEVVAGYPDRILPRPGHEADLKKRTLTNLYNQRPPWLDQAHKALDLAVAEAYGWADYSDAMADEEILRRLLKLNLERAGR